MLGPRSITGGAFHLKTESRGATVFKKYRKFESQFSFKRDWESWVFDKIEIRFLGYFNIIEIWIFVFGEIKI